MIGVVVVIPKTLHSVMASASGLLLDADQCNLMYPNQATINFATVNCLLMLPSVMELISICLDGQIRIIEVSGECGEWQPFGVPSLIGLSPFTSEIYLSLCCWG